MTLTKSGSTARTMTFPDASIVVAGSTSALTSGIIPVAVSGGLLADATGLTYLSGNLSGTAGTTPAWQSASYWSAGAGTVRAGTAVIVDGTGSGSITTLGGVQMAGALSGATSGTFSNYVNIGYNASGTVTGGFSLSRATGWSAFFRFQENGTDRAQLRNTVTTDGLGLWNGEASLEWCRASGTTLAATVFNVYGTGAGSITTAGGIAMSGALSGVTTLAASGLVATTASGAFGASALLASERVRVAGGTMGTPGSTDVLIADGRISTGSSVVVGGALTVTSVLNVGGDLTGAQNKNSAALFLWSNSSTGTSASAGFEARGDSAGSYRTRISHYGTGYTGTVFGVTAAGYGSILASGSSNGMLIGCPDASKPLYFGSGSTIVGQFSAAGSFVLGNSALATTATDGFPYIPTCAGTPTGTPTTFTGRVPLIYDSTNNKLYAYNSAWKAVTLA